jgi:hypothetical protein
MKIGIGLPNHVRGTLPTVIPGWAARGEQAGFSTLGSVGRMAYPGDAGAHGRAVLRGDPRRVGEGRARGFNPTVGDPDESPGSLTSCSD